MSAEDSPAVLVARFLRANNYNETLDAFLSEAGLPPDTGSSDSPDSLTIEQILHEKKLYDLDQAFQKVAVDDGRGWRHHAPSIPTIVDTLPYSSNILHVDLQKVDCQTGDGGLENLIVATGADKSVNFLSPVSPFSLRDGRIPTSESPVLSCAFVSPKYCVTSSMSGRIALQDLSTGLTLDERKDHFKYVVKVVYTTNSTGQWLVTAAWDAKVLVYWLGPPTSSEEHPPPKLRNPVAEIKLPSNPEAVVFVHHPEIANPVLVLTRRDSTFLYYYSIPEIQDLNLDSPPVSLDYLGRQNLAPHSNVWVSFTPSAIALSPNDPEIIAIATSAVPHMKLIVARMLFPPPQLRNGEASIIPQHATQVIQARAELALQHREEAAILLYCTTMAPQTPYSTPALAWRPDGSGIYVNGDDGVVRGIETDTGKVIATLSSGHDPGSKVRCLWVGWASEDGEDEIIISGGFDRRLIVWRADNKST